MLLLVFAQVGRQGAKIVVELLGVFLANASDFVKNGIGWHDYSSISSSGVQITGQR